MQLSSQKGLAMPESGTVLVYVDRDNKEQHLFIIRLAAKYGIPIKVVRTSNGPLPKVVARVKGSRPETYSGVANVISFFKTHSKDKRFL